MRSRTARLALMLAVAAAFGCGADEATEPVLESRAPGDGGISREAFSLPAVRVERADGTPVYRKQVLSAVFTVDQIFRSMQGPVSNLEVHFDSADGAEPELLWVVGYEAVMVGPDGETPLSQEFMCHSNLIIDDETYHDRFKTKIATQGERLFTLAQGQLSLELPPGFGMPWMSDWPFIVNSQVLNHNVKGEVVEVRAKITVDYLRDADLPSPLTPLVQHGVFGLKLLEGRDGHFGLLPQQVDEQSHGPGCSLGEDAGSEELISDGTGKRFTGFWVLPPGREVNRTRVTSMLALPYDTTIHYIAVHLHPFAEYLELRDLTTGETVYRSKARQVGHGIGLAEVDHYASPNGIPVYKDHEYELVSVYNNVSGEDQDAMASMFIYLRAQDLYQMDFRPGGQSS